MNNSTANIMLLAVQPPFLNGLLASVRWMTWIIIPCKLRIMLRLSWYQSLLGIWMDLFGSPFVWTSGLNFAYTRILSDTDSWFLFICVWRNVRGIRLCLLIDQFILARFWVLIWSLWIYLALLTKISDTIIFIHENRSLFGLSSVGRRSSWRILCLFLRFWFHVQTNRWLRRRNRLEILLLLFDPCFLQRI